MFGRTRHSRVGKKLEMQVQFQFLFQFQFCNQTDQTSCWEWLKISWKQNLIDFVFLKKWVFTFSVYIVFTYFNLELLTFLLCLPRPQVTQIAKKKTVFIFQSKMHKNLPLTFFFLTSSCNNSTKNCFLSKKQT